MKQAERFFHLPQATKEALHIKKSRYGFGWEPSEYTSIAGDIETKEGFNLGYEAGLDRSGGDGKYRNLDGSEDEANFWPKEEDLPGFYEGVAEYYGAVSGQFRNGVLYFLPGIMRQVAHVEPIDGSSLILTNQRFWTSLGIFSDSSPYLSNCLKTISIL